MSAALEVIDTAGIEGLTIRAVASVAGAPPMSLYTHFSSKEELLDLLHAEIVRRFYADHEHATWQAGLLAVCQQIHEVLTAHPRWAPLLSRPAPPIAVPLRERLLSLMIADGMSAERAFATLSSAILMAMGLTVVELTFTGAQGRSSIEQWFERLSAWVETPSGAEHQVTRAAVSKVDRFDLDDNFGFTLHTFISGLASNSGGARWGRGALNDADGRWSNSEVSLPNDGTVLQRS